MTNIDINCDMGESFGHWKLGDDQAIMPYITSANVACGAHAGDPNVMAETVRLAVKHKVAVGAHPGYPDLPGFGRRTMQLQREEVVNTILYQLGALSAVAHANGAELTHVKPHGALYNEASQDRQLADSIVEAISRFSTSLALVGLPNSQLEAAAHGARLPFLREGFADRAYEPNGLLRNRKLPDALIAAPERAAEQALQLARGQVTAADGSTLVLQVDTICIHGDTPGAASIARAVREALRGAGFNVAAPGVVQG